MSSTTQDTVSELADLRKRYNSLVDATLQNQQAIGKLRDENISLRRDLDLADKLIVASDGNNQLLGNALNERMRDATSEIQRLQGLLKTNGIRHEGD